MPGDYGNVNGFFWVPIVGPLIGGAIGAYVYDLLIRDTLHSARRAARPGDRRRGQHRRGGTRPA